MSELYAANWSRRRRTRQEEAAFKIDSTKRGAILGDGGQGPELSSAQTAPTSYNTFLRWSPTDPDFDMGVIISYPTPKATSSVGSASSVQSVRGNKPVTNILSRKPSMHSLGSSSYQEIVFDSKSGNSSSQASASSGRRGPLGEVARAAMNAVRAVRACWKCKFLRKTVSTANSIPNW
jgi:hypothetical protein